MKFLFTNKAEKQFHKLSQGIQKQLITKLKEIKEKGIGDFKIVINLLPATHRLRIGEYRFLLKKEKDGDFLVLKVGHRRDIYL